jgi:V/A-type H+/Na+-transporting ATPase subunit I
MRWREVLRPVTMQRVALLAPRDRLRAVLVGVADEGTVEVDVAVSDPDLPETTTPAAARLHRLGPGAAGAAALAATAPDLDRCEQAGRVDLIAGEAQMERRSAQAVTRGSVAGLVGWMAADDMPHLAGRLAGCGGAVVALPRPAGLQAPTLLSQTGAAREFAPLVQTYATVPYADVDPSLLAGVAFIVMFGMMFADVGHGAILLLAAVAIRSGRMTARMTALARLRSSWGFLAGAGVSSMAFGALYGEFFGPTHVIGVVWLAPLDHPVQLLGAAVVVGAVLLAGAYVLGSVNRFREGGWRLALYASTGLAGSALFLGLGAVVGGLYSHHSWVEFAGAGVGVVGLAATYVGLSASAGGGVAGSAQAAVELFNLVVRLGSNLVSFARLAAFGLTHAALCAIVWDATGGLWRHGVAGAAGAVLVFAVGNAMAFALEGLVAAIQALRLEYFELFSRVFDSEGRPFRPWHVPLATTEEPC